MELTVADIEEQLTYLLKAQVDDPRWSQSSLLNLPMVERQFTASRQVGVRPAQANLNLALCLLQASNQLVPASPLGHARAWKMLIGAELNCLGAVRGYAAGILVTEVPQPLKSIFRECAKQTALTASELIDAEPRALKQLVSRTVTALWLWKTGEAPAFTTSADWRDLIDKFSGAQVWTRDVIYAQRAKFIKELAKYLASEQAASQLPGLGPQEFEIADLPTTRPPIADEPAVVAPSAEESKPATPIEEPSIEVKPPAIDTIELYLDRVLPAAPQYVPVEWQSLSRRQPPCLRSLSKVKLAAARRICCMRSGRH